MLLCLINSRIMLTTTFLYDRNPSSLLNGKSSLVGVSLEYHKMKVFDYWCFPCLCPYWTSKLDRKSTPCIFVGYPVNQDGYMCLDLTTCKTYISRYVRYDETKFSLNTLLHRDYDETLPDPQSTLDM